MGLNDLTLEKLVGEINGYKGKMRAIHEDYGRASAELQDRINVLGYNLNEHLKETKDQIASTPQRLLNLETKYVAGEVNESEYRQQREEFKGLLQRNLRSIEEIRSMIEVLTHIESRPLTPADFKQPSTVVAKPTPENWTNPASISTTPIGPRFDPTPVAQANLRLTPERPATPSESNGNNWPGPSSQPANASTITPPAPLVEGGNILAPAPSTPTPQPEPATATSPEAISATGTLDSEAASIDEATATVPSVDIVEGSGSDDTLMVKVVDDLPAVEASSTVVSPDISQLQPSVGLEQTVVPGTTTDVAQVSLTPPTQFYKVVCPKCGADVPKPVKVWELKGGKSKKNVLIGLFQCQDCRVKFREALTREIL